MKKLLYLLFAITLLGCGSENMNNEAVTPSCGSEVQNYVTIGTQTWSTNNLDVTTYCNGTEIPQVDSDANNYDEWVNLSTSLRDGELL
jgi:hypothetical protein